MASPLDHVDFTKRDEPDWDLGMRDLLVDWLDYQRIQFRRKLRDLDPANSAGWAVPPLELSVLGLVRHLTQVEHHYLTWGLGGGEDTLAYGDDDFAGGSAESFDDDVRLYLEEVDHADQAIAALGALDSLGLGHGRSLGATLVKIVQEYALHNGQAHMLRYAALGEIIR